MHSPVWKPPPMVLVHRQPRVLPHRSFLQDDEAPSPSWNYHWPPTPTIKVTSKVRSIHLPITSLSPHKYLTQILLSPHYNLTITSLSDSPHLAPLWPPLLFGFPPLPPWTTISIELRLARKDWNCPEFLQHQHLKVWAHPVMHFFAWHSLHSPSSPSHPCSTGLASLPMVGSETFNELFAFIWFRFWSIAFISLIMVTKLLVSVAELQGSFQCFCHFDLWLGLRLKLKCWLLISPGLPPHWLCQLQCLTFFNFSIFFNALFSQYQLCFSRF